MMDRIPLAPCPPRPRKFRGALIAVVFASFGLSCAVAASGAIEDGTASSIVTKSTGTDLDPQPPGSILYLLGYDHRWYWTAGLATVAVLAGLILHARRRVFRRAWHIGPRRTLVVPVVLLVALVTFSAAAMATAAAGGRIYASLSPTDAAASQTVQNANADSTRFWAAAGLSVGLVGLVASTAAWLWLERRGRRQWLAETCPRCGATDSWNYLTLEQAGDSGENSTRPYAPEADELAQRDDEFLLVCENMLPTAPPAACGWSMLERWEQTPRLNLSILGLPDSGKTQWLAMVYYQLRQGLFPESVRCRRERLPSVPALDRAAEDIVAGLGAPSTPDEGLPLPVVMPFRDGDRFGSSDVLLHVFDYPGGTTTRTGPDDYRVQQSLVADGILLFVDPTAPAPRQQDAFVRLAAQLSHYGTRPDGSRESVPVAVCLAKIDLLVDLAGGSTGGQNSIDEFYRQLQQIDPDGTRFSNRTLQARDRLCRRLCESLWPDWDVEAQARECFGRAWQWFPVTGVGLDSLGSTDPRDATLAPFGLIEPLLWLLHVNGYPM